MITTAISALLISAVAKTTAPNFAALEDLDHGAKVTIMREIDGKLFVGGKFERANRKLANNIAVWDGTAWSTVGKGVDGEVKDICAVGKDIYVCGDFSYVNKGKNDEGIEAYQIAKWNGTTWSALAPKTVDRQIYALATDGKDLYIGGNFKKINDETETNAIAKWNGKKFVAMGGAFDRYIWSMVFVGSKLYVGGYFAEFGDDSFNNVAVYNAGKWSEAGSGGLSSTVKRLITDGKDVYAAGEFTLGGSCVAKFDGAKWSPVGKVEGGAEWIHLAGGKLYIAGESLSKVNGKNTHNVAILEGDKVSILDELIYSHHRTIFPYKGSTIIGGDYTDTRIAAIGGCLKWDGTSKEVGKLATIAE
jgi:trimeric autotransporter adhesin